MKKNKDKDFTEGRLKQPNSMVMMCHPFDVAQGRVVSAIVEKLQDFMGQCVDKTDLSANLKKINDDSFGEYSEGRLILSFTYKEVGVTSNNYSALRKSLIEMATIPVGLIVYDRNRNPWEMISHFCTPILPTESNFEGKQVEAKYGHSFKVMIERPVLEYLIDTRKGWHTYLRKVVMQTKNKYAFRFYLLISSWKTRKETPEYTVTYLREWMNMGKKCARWTDFKTRVIAPAEKELREMFSQGICDVCFDTEYIYKEGKPRRGEPDKLKFIITSFDENALTVESENVTPQSDIDRYLFLEFTLTAKDRENILSLVTDENREDFYAFCESLSKNYRKANPKNISSYCHTALVKFFKDWKPKVVEVKAESIIDKYQKTKINKQEGVEIWDKVLSVCRDRMDADLFATWIKPLKYLGKRENKCFYHLPTSKFGREMYQAGAYDQLLAICRELYPDLAFETK